MAHRREISIGKRSNGSLSLDGSVQSALALNASIISNSPSHSRIDRRELYCTLGAPLSLLYSCIFYNTCVRYWRLVCVLSPPKVESTCISSGSILDNRTSHRGFFHCSTFSPISILNSPSNCYF